MNKQQKQAFIREWENIVKVLKQSQHDLSKKQISSREENPKNRFHFKKDEISVFLNEWDRVITALKRSKYDLSKIKLIEEVQ